MIAVTFALPAESSEFVRLRRTVAVLHTGVGKRAVDRTLLPFLKNHAPDLLISAGFAGAVTDSFQVGDVFVAENFSDPSLVGITALRRAKLATISRVADSTNERMASGGDAVDMETEFIAEACAQRGIRMLSLRAISDTPAAPFGIPADVLFDVERQQTDTARLVGHLVRRPIALRQLLIIARQVKTARRSLSVAVCAALDALR
jgi:nucleoside phosphorylase